MLAQWTLPSHDSHTLRTPRASIIGGARKSGLAYSDPGLTYTEGYKVYQCQLPVGSPMLAVDTIRSDSLNSLGPIAFYIHCGISIRIWEFMGGGGLIPDFNTWFLIHWPFFMGPKSYRCISVTKSTVALCSALCTIDIIHLMSVDIPYHLRLLALQTNQQRE